LNHAATATRRTRNRLLQSQRQPRRGRITQQTKVFGHAGSIHNRGGMSTRSSRAVKLEYSCGLNERVAALA
jgi:hypothetical protein